MPHKRELEHVKALLAEKRAEEQELWDVIADITSDIDLGSVFQKVGKQVSKMLDADRATLFLNDEERNELFSIIGAGSDAIEIRLPNHAGIAGDAFSSSKCINIPHPYDDPRFNPAFDKQTGYVTRSILCVPVINQAGKTIGVLQLLNKCGGPFTDGDESRVKTFITRVSIALVNAKLSDDIQKMKNFDESILEAMSFGVIILDENRKIIKFNNESLNIMRITKEDIQNCQAEDFFSGANAWITDKIVRVEETQEPDTTMDTELEFGGEKIWIYRLNVVPLAVSTEDIRKISGSMIMIEGSNDERRMKSTMSRYMDPGVADQLLADGEELLGGRSTLSTVLFSDIRSFATLTEELGALGTVSFLNEYFTIMVDCIQREEGFVDKFVGDGIIAAFGIPMPHEDGEDRAVRAAIAMINELFEWNRYRIAQGKKAIDMGIALNTGMIVAGNIGSPKRMDYTMIGGEMNLASQLKSACKQYFARILITESTKAGLKGEYKIREVDQVVVKGKTKPISIYEVLDYHNEETFPSMTEVIRLFEEGLKYCREQKWDIAVEAFRNVLELNRNDRLAELYIDRCKYLRENPPSDENPSVAFPSCHRDTETVWMEL